MFIRCPSCGETDIVPSSAVGKMGQCNACRHTFQISDSDDLIGQKNDEALAEEGAMGYRFPRVISTSEIEPRRASPAGKISPKEDKFTFGCLISYHSSKPAVKAILASILVICFLICFLPLLAWFVGSYNEELKENDKAYEREIMQEKADAMRREGLQGSDKELAKDADSLKQFNELEQRRLEERKRILGY